MTYILALPSASPLWWTGTEWTEDRCMAREFTEQERHSIGEPKDGSEWFEIEAIGFV